MLHRIQVEKKQPTVSKWFIAQEVLWHQWTFIRSIVSSFFRENSLQSHSITNSATKCQAQLVLSYHHTHIHTHTHHTCDKFQRGIDQGDFHFRAISEKCMKYRKTFEPPHNTTNKITVRPAKTQISLGIHPVWSESSLPAWRNLGSLDTHWAADTRADLSLLGAQSFRWFCHEAAHFMQIRES